MNPDIQRKFEEVSNAIKTHGEELARYPGVLAVQSGFATHAGEISDEPSIVVLVLRKVAAENLAESAILPESIAGVMVDVRQASVEEQIELFQGHPAGDSVIAFLEEKAAGAGDVDPRSPVEQEKASGAALEAERVDYPKPDFSLAEVNEPMTVVLHASPDNGWSELKKFLTGPVEHLSATIFEFEAKYVLNAIIEACGDEGTMDFVMHYKAAANKWDGADAARELKDALGDRLQFAWAPVVMTRATTEGWFPSSYHEKVIVKDHRYFWLSSGNWKGSGQPLEDPFNPPHDFDEVDFLKSKNREWHVIVDCPALAQQFERFIQHDLVTASEVQIPEVLPESEFPDVFIPARPVEPEVEPEWFAPLTLDNTQLQVTPLLSPDDFVEQVTALVKTATRRLYIQNQYLKPTDIERWRELNEFVRDFSQADGVDFKLIIRDIKYWDSIDKMKEFGFDTSNVRVLAGTHTKGIIVDDQAIVIGSHNWSGQGFMENRDASLIFYDERVISHYEKLFNFDYSRAFRPRRRAPETEPFFARAGEATPAGMRRVAWASYTEE